MRPIKLSIQGFNSFEQKQTIDFDQLTKSGLFGIVGPTGSGKTSILDAITMALYGQMARFDGEKRKITHCMNVNSDKMSIEFHFKLLNGNQENTYIIERYYEKKKEDAKLILAKLSEKKNDLIELMAEGSTDVLNATINLIGLSYEDFTRSVILPQGKFSQFLLLANRERRDMLERIFKFEKYGDKLVKKINKRILNNKQLLNTIASNLQIYGDVSGEQIKADKKLYDEAIMKLEELSKLEIEKTNMIARIENIVALQGELQQNEAKMKLFTEKEDSINRKKFLLNNIKIAEIIKPLYDERMDTTKKIDLLNKELEVVAEAFNNATNEEETAKKQYEDILVLKQEKYPEMLELKTKLDRAIEYYDTTIKEEKQLSELIKKNSQQINILEIKKTDKEKIIFQKEEKENELQKLTIEKQEYDVDSVIREKVLEAYDLEKRRQEISELFRKQKEKYNEKDNEYKKLTIEFIEVEKQYEMFLKNVEILKLDIENLIKQEPLFDKTEKNEEIVKGKAVLEQIHEKIKALEKIKEEEMNNENAYKEKKSLNESLNQDIAEKEKILLKLENEIIAFERNNSAYLLAKDLRENDKCPVCGSTEHKQLAEIADLQELEDLKREYSALKEDISNVRKKIEILNSGVLFLSQNLEALKKKIKEEEHDIYTVKLNNVTLEDYENKLNIKQREFDKAIQEREGYDTAKKAAEEKFQKEKDECQKVAINHARLQQVILKDEALLKDIKFELTKTYEELNELKEKLNNSKLELGIENTAWDAYQEIIEKDKKRKGLEERENIIRLELVENSKQISVIEERIKLIEKEVDQDSFIILDKKKRLLDLKAEIDSISKDRDPKQYKTEVEKEINNILENEKTYRENLAAFNRNKQILSEKQAVCMKQQLMLKQIKENNENKLEEALCKQNVSNICEIKEYFSEISKKQSLISEIEGYDEQVYIIRTNISITKEKLGNDQLLNSAIILQEQKEELKNYKDSILSYTEKSAILKERIQTMTQSLVEVEKLIKNRMEITKSQDLLEELSSLFNGNKFTEHLSIKQLIYITEEATKRLRSITGGRYSLELYNTDFIVRDDANGGIRRTPKSLSGGETFIVSLCLALALSSKIQFKNSAPLEFFFLDEGFGSLDAMAIESVFVALEKLQTEKLSVGIITHVEELKNRLNKKLIVIPPEQGISGTVVYIE